MNNSKTFILILGFSLLSKMGNGTDLVRPVGTLTAEISGTDIGGQDLRERRPNQLEFILKAHKYPVAVYEEWNSWGFYARTFFAHDVNNPKLKYKIERTSNGWDSNYPSTQIIYIGEPLVTKINFCDGSWYIDPLLSQGKDHRLILQGQYRVFDTDHFGNDIKNMNGPPWQGNLETNKIEITIPRDLVKCLNNYEIWFYQKKHPSAPIEPKLGL
jgi:hypothetical protein